MTYKQLLAALQKLDAEQLNMDVTVFDIENQEVFPAKLEIAKNSDEDEEDSGMFDPGQPYLSFSVEEYDEAPRKPAPPPTAEEIAAEKARIAEMLRPIDYVEKSRKVQQELNKNPLLKKTVIYSK